MVLVPNVPLSSAISLKNDLKKKNKPVDFHII